MTTANTLELVLHMAGGTVGLISGFTALASKKGGSLHRQSGSIYFMSMIAMALTGGYIAWVNSVFVTVLAAGLTVYLITSSWFTIKTRENTVGASGYLSLLLGLCVLILGGWLSVGALGGSIDYIGDYAVPAAIYIIFTAIILIGVVTDLRFISIKGLSGKQRILRHLWRMCVPLYVATSSFFTGQQQVFPESLQGTFYLSIPEYGVLVAMLFWLAKIRLSKPKDST
jgi:uncharacterized membrane protein